MHSLKTLCQLFCTFFLTLQVNQVHNAVMKFKKWLESLPGSPTPTVAGRKAGLVTTTVLRHAEKDETNSDTVIAIARAYGVPPVDALVDLGFLRADEAGGEAVRMKEALKEASISQLWDTMADKIDGLHLTVGKFPRMDDIDVTVIEPQDDLEARRRRALEKANRGEAAAQRRTPKLEEPELP